MKITVRKVKGGYAAFKNGKQWSGVYTKEEAKNAAKFLRESKFKEVRR